MGRWGEAESAAYLKKKGYRLLAANYKSRFGEIDLIVRDKKYVVFVEVKLRKNIAFAQALEHVDHKKQQKIRTTAELWLCDNECGLQPRFDVIEIYAPNGMNGPPERINHIINAFE